MIFSENRCPLFGIMLWFDNNDKEARQAAVAFVSYRDLYQDQPPGRFRRTSIFV